MSAVTCILYRTARHFACLRFLLVAERTAVMRLRQVGVSLFGKTADRLLSSLSLAHRSEGISVVLYFVAGDRTIWIELPKNTHTKK